MLEGLHYQNGYVCDDIEACIALFRDRAGIGAVRIFDIDQLIDTPGGRQSMSNRIAMFRVHNLQYELIQPVADPIGVYANAPSNGGPMRFHHACMRVDDWDAFRARVARQDLPVVMERANAEDALKYLYLDARRFCGHYLEYTWMTDERWEMISRM